MLLSLLAFFERGGKTITQSINLIVAIGVALMFGPDNLRMDSLGTHLVENTIGIARSASFDPRWPVILSSFAHAELRKQLADKLGLTLHVSKRINQGGCKLENDDPSKIKTPEWWNSYDITHFFKKRR